MRNQQYDIVKGVAIFLMVLCHAGCGQSLRNFIYLFHMAVFFIAAGWFFKRIPEISGIYKFVWVKLKRLWIPFVVYGTFVALVHNWCFRLGFYDEGAHPVLGHLWSLRELIVHLIKGFFMADWFYGLTGTFWFLRALFWGLLFYGISDLFLRKLSGGRVFLSILSLAILYLSQYGNERPICYVGGANMMTAFCLIHLGVLLRAVNFKLENLNRLSALGVVIAFGFVLVGLGNFGAVNLDANDFPNIFVLLLSSVAGWFFLCGIANLLTATFAGRMIAFLGRHTMPILLFHFAAFKLVTAIGMMFVKEGNLAGIPCSYFGWNWCIAYTIAGIFVPLGLWWVYARVVKHEAD